MKKSCCLKIVFSFFLFIVLINNVNAGVSIDDCGELGKLTIEMTSNGENAGFDAREITCSWEYVGMKNMGKKTWYSDFDIDYNQNKYLLETRQSGALIKPKSAIVLTVDQG